MPNVKNTMIDRLLAAVAPHLCCGCGKTGSLLCDNCKYDITSTPFIGCIVCKTPHLMGVCMQHNITYKRAWVVGVRSGVLQRLIGGYKFQNMKAAAEVLAGLLDQRLPSLPADTIIVPVPTAPAHIRERGYDHLLLIAQHFAAKRGLTVSKVVARNSTATQHHAGRKDRIRQAKEAFRISGSIDPAAPYLLLDDIVTTGSTIDQASRLLSANGASTVWVGALARQPLD